LLGEIEQIAHQRAGGNGFDAVVDAQFRFVLHNCSSAGIIRGGLARPIDPQSPVRIGETVLVRLTLSASSALGYLLVEEPKPAGFEIDQVLPDGADRPYGTWGEARDDHAAFFVRNLDAGDTAIEYLLRPEVPGTFTALPASAGSPSRSIARRSPRSPSGMASGSPRTRIAT